MNAGAEYLADVRKLARYYKGLAEDAIAQVDDVQFSTPLGEEENSIALLVKHVAGNLRSRWTDFLTTDGEKPDRVRDAEFEVHAGDSRAELMQAWERGWAAFLGTLDALAPDELVRTVLIRGEPHTVTAAVNRALTHAGYHAGQVVLLAKHFAGAGWRSLSIPRGQSRPFSAGVAERQRER